LEKIMKAVLWVLVGVVAFPSFGFGKTINPPKRTAEEIIKIVGAHIKTEKIDVTNHFLGRLEYKNLHNEYEKPYWHLRYMKLIGSSEEKFQLNFYVGRDGVVRRDKSAFKKGARRKGQVPPTK
jgi:hypothetical protein